MNETRLLWTINGFPLTLKLVPGGFAMHIGEAEPAALVETPDELVFRMRDGGIECRLRCDCNPLSKTYQDLVERHAALAPTWPPTSGPKE